MTIFSKSLQRKPISAAELATVPHEQWQQLRSTLRQHQQKRVQPRQFRRVPQTYLAQLEQKLLQQTLPP